VHCPATETGLLGKKALIIGVIRVTLVVTLTITLLPEVDGFGLSVTVRPPGNWLA